ncbi:MAG: Ig-like domain-containing protein, partial [bacterium]|nr:Ig-like domain-containing protein [bacterium]
TGSTPSIDYLKVKGSGVTEKDGKYYIGKDAKEVTIETHIKTTTKDLDTVEFSFNPSISGFPIKFDYHNHSQWTDFDGHNLKIKGMRCDSYTSKGTPYAKDTFYYDWEIPKDVKDGEYKLKVTAKTVKGENSSKGITVIIDLTPPKVKETKPVDDPEGKIEVPIDTEIEITLEDPKKNDYASGIDLKSLKPEVCKIYPKINGTWKVKGEGFIFIPNELLKEDTIYKVTIPKEAAKDKAGNELESHI